MEKEKKKERKEKSLTHPCRINQLWRVCTPIKNSNKLVLLAYLWTPDVISVIINISVGNSYLSAASAIVDLGQVKGAYSTAGKSINANEAHKKE